ncbi:FAD/NAD(P)-binding protein [Trinickia fusca]|uniref:FAD-dependent oxidoreductase n=1 Tax=Trinickia fusca TaxID=2419777 RepID=A0A494X6K5_9BURK|nr:FAD/NAD(P)-binding protein [Trinickia fusca]RKP45261.1 FAD-dependent oxidoreductase [Trinickia fusca]
MKRKTLILGGGIVGVAAFVSLVRHRGAEAIDIVNPGPIGLGRAFATTETPLLTNTSVDTLSILADDKDDFLDYLRARGVPANPGSCVPRFYVSQYARDRYDQYARAAAQAGIAHRHHRAMAIEVRKVGQHAYQVQLDTGEIVEADNVMICCGFGQPLVPEYVAPHVGKDGLFVTPYPEGALLAALPQSSRVLVLGTRLSAIDAALLLCGQGHSVVMASRSGELPSVRTQLLRLPPGRIDKRRFATLALTGPNLRRQLLRLIGASARVVPALPLSKQVSRATDIETRLREEIQLAESGQNNWQNIIIELLEMADTLLVSAGPAVQQRVLDACWSLVQRYLFSFPVGNAKALLSYIESGRLKIIAGAPRELAEQAGEWAVTWADDSVQTFDAVVCATGFHRPRFHARAQEIEIVTDLSRRAEPPAVGPDLRVTLPESQSPEDIWLIGVSSYLRSALTSIVYQGAKQADAIASAMSRDNVDNTSELAGSLQ